MPRREERLEQQERLPPQEQSRWAAKSSRWDGLLTFDTKGEIIILSGGIADLPAHLKLYSPFLRIYSSFIVGVAFCAFGIPERGQSWHSWQRPRNSATSTPRHSFRRLTAVERSKLFPKSRRYLLRATRPMLSFT